MAIYHLPLLDDERWYVIHVNQGRDQGHPAWRSSGLWLHGPNSEAHVEWSLFGQGFGWGFQAGRNGSESDLGLNLYAGRLGSLWLRIRAPWTRWARVSKDRDPEHWYYARHYGLRLHPHDGCIVSGEWGSLDGYWSRERPRWRDWSVTWTTVLGKMHTEWTEGKSGTCAIPLPEGVYEGEWIEKSHDARHLRWPGTWRDKLKGGTRRRYINVRVDGGIPVEGKGENSWDCGMDGVFGTSGDTLAEAVCNFVTAVLRDRERYGGPHDLTRPMTVQEAEARTG